MKELLSGQGAPALGASHEENAGFGEARDLGPGDVEKMFGPAKTPLERLRAAGRVEETPAEMGGGGEVDPVEKYFVDGQGNLEAMGKFIEAQRQAGLGDERQINVGDKPLCSFGEYQKAYEAIKVAQARGDRRPIEEIVREARQPAPRPPEPQPAPRPGDWKANLPPDQRQRLQAFEAKITNFDPAQLQFMLMRLKELQAMAPIDGWQSREVKEGDTQFYLRALDEKLVEIERKQQPRGTGITERTPLAGLSPEAKMHVDGLIKRFEKEKQLNNVSFGELVRLVQEEYRKAGLIGRNVPEWLFPPMLKPELLRSFGLPPEIPVQGNGGRE